MRTATLAYLPYCQSGEICDGYDKSKQKVCGGVLEGAGNRFENFHRSLAFKKECDEAGDIPCDENGEGAYCGRHHGPDNTRNNRRTWVTIESASVMFLMGSSAGYIISGTPVGNVIFG